MMLSASLLRLFLAFTVGLVSVSGQVVVDQSDLKSEEILASKPLIGYRQISKEFFAHLDTPGGKLPMNVVYESARRSAWGPTLSHWADSSGSKLEDLDVVTYREWLNSFDTAAWRPNLVDVRSPTGVLTADRYILAALPATELAGGKLESKGFQQTKDIKDIYWGDQPIPARGKEKYLLIDPNAVGKVQTAYAALDMAKDAPPSAQPVYFAIASKSLNDLPGFQRAAAFKAGQVTFGRPIARRVPITGAEGGRSAVTEDNSDLVLMILAVSVRELRTEEVKSITYSVSAKPDATAYDLVPLSVTLGSQEPQQGPILKLVGVDLLLKDSKPKIFAQGLQESAFSWVMTESAIEPGSHRFVALLQVPKGSKQLVMTFAITCKLKDPYLSQGGVLYQDVRDVTVTLP